MQSWQEETDNVSGGSIEGQPMQTEDDEGEEEEEEGDGIEGEGDEGEEEDEGEDGDERKEDDQARREDDMEREEDEGSMVCLHRPAESTSIPAGLLLSSLVAVWWMNNCQLSVVPLW